MSGPYDRKVVDPDTIWQWLLIPDPPNSQAASKLINFQQTGAMVNINQYDEPVEIFNWDYYARGTPGSGPRWE